MPYPPVRLILQLCLLLVLTRSAAAQAPPKFEFAKPPEKPSPWSLQAKGGMLVTGGNSQSTNFNFGVVGAHLVDANRVSLDGAVAYGRSSILVPVLDAMGDVAALDRQPQTTTNQWRARGRYDRFFTTNNSGYVLGQLGADRVAGKRLLGGGQVGYSRQIAKNAVHTTVAELGYDYSFERYFAQPDRTIDPASIHSARAFVGELAKLSNDTGVSASVEALFNVNAEKAPNASDPARNDVPAFKDTRIIGKAGMTTTLRGSLSVALGFTVSYDQNPAPRPVPASAGGAHYAPGFRPFAARVDTLTEASLIFTFL